MLLSLQVRVSLYSVVRESIHRLSLSKSLYGADVLTLLGREILPE